MGKIVKNGIEYGGSSGGQPYDDTELRSEIAELSGEVADKITLADIPIADVGTFGLVAYGSNAGIRKATNNGALTIDRASETNIDLRNNAYKPITPTNLVHAVDSVITSKAATEQLTDEQQTAARKRLGLEKEWELKGTLIDSEIQVDLTGCTELMIKGVVKSTGGVHLMANIGKLVNNILPDTGATRRFMLYWVDMYDSLMGISGRYASSKTATELISNATPATRVGKITKEIQMITFSTWEVVTECNLEIWAR